MNMTGDPNQRNQSLMFNIGCSYPSPASNIPLTNNDFVGAMAPVASGSRMENPSQGLPTNNQPSFMYNSPQQPESNVQFPFNYMTPSTGSPFESGPTTNFSFNMPQTSNSFPNVLRQTSNQFSVNLFQNCGPSSSNSTASNHLNYNFSLKPLSGSFGCKRKTDSQSFVPLKQHITEERMAEHMSRLHISSETPTSKETQPIRERRLYMCEEMQRLQTESIIPAQILEKVNRPCTALVPWRPPIVLTLPKENNNNEDEPDNMNDRSDGNDIDMDL